MPPGWVLLPIPKLSDSLEVDRQTYLRGCATFLLWAEIQQQTNYILVISSGFSLETRGKRVVKRGLNNCIWLKWETWDAFILQEKKNKTFREFNCSNLERTTSKALEGCAPGICRFRKILAVLTVLRDTVVAKCYISTSILTNLNQYFPITSLALDLYLFLILS